MALLFFLVYLKRDFLPSIAGMIRDGLGSGDLAYFFGGFVS